MKWYECLEEWSKRNDAVDYRDRYSMVLWILALAGLCLQVPLILNVIIQVCFFVCTIHLIYLYVKRGCFIMSIIKIGLIFIVCLMDNMFFTISPTT